MPQRIEETLRESEVARVWANLTYYLMQNEGMTYEQADEWAKLQLEEALEITIV